MERSRNFADGGGAVALGSALGAAVAVVVALAAAFAVLVAAAAVAGGLGAVGAGGGEQLASEHAAASATNGAVFAPSPDCRRAMAGQVITAARRERAASAR